jgi:glycerophosphoryl diester phosphodiesterase
MTEKKRISIKKIVFYFLLLVIIVPPLVNLSIASFIPLPKNIILRIGHRGGAGLAPENTLPAMDSGLAYQVNYLETDIRQTRDSQLVIMHDKSVDRTTNGTGSINKLTYNEINALNASKSFPGYNNKTRVPLLQDLLKKISQSHAKLIIEIKDPGLYPGMIPRLVKMIQESQAIDHVAIFSFNKDAIQEVKETLPGVETGIFCLGLDGLNGSADFKAPNWISILYFPFLVNRFHRKSEKVLVWTPNNLFWMKYLCKMNVDGIISDRPDILTSLNTLQKMQ